MDSNRWRTCNRRVAKCRYPAATATLVIVRAACWMADSGREIADAVPQIEAPCCRVHIMEADAECTTPGFLIDCGSLRHKGFRQLPGCLAGAARGEPAALATGGAA